MDRRAADAALWPIVVAHYLPDLEFQAALEFDWDVEFHERP